MDSGNDGGTLGTTAGSDCCCCWHDIKLAQNQLKKVQFTFCYNRLFIANFSFFYQSTALSSETELDINETEFGNN